MNAQDSAKQTRTAWNFFKRLTDDELDALLNTAGVVPMQDRSMKLQQACTVWFHSHIPNMNEICTLANEPLNSKHTVAADAAKTWLQKFSDDEEVWKEWPAADVLTLFHEAQNEL